MRLYAQRRGKKRPIAKKNDKHEQYHPLPCGGLCSKFGTDFRKCHVSSRVDKEKEKKSISLQNNLRRKKNLFRKKFSLIQQQLSELAQKLWGMPRHDFPQIARR